MVCELLKSKEAIPFGAMMVCAHPLRGKAVVASHPPVPSHVPLFPWLFPLLHSKFTLN